MLDLLAAAGDAIRWDMGPEPGIHLGSFFTIRYYSLAYLAGLLLAYWHTTKMTKAPGAPMAQRHVDDLFFYCTLGVILGGRLGYAAFYTGGDTGKPSLFTHFTPGETVSWDLLRLWDGGMSFHGGLWGKPSSVPWAMMFCEERGPGGVCALFGVPRHPSQLYEALLEGVLVA